ncbi:MAG: S9 family peptidase [Verrucomicrobia bacterium]|nr:S9 family peptidase [Verrucomicrobiota bacterium]
MPTPRVSHALLVLAFLASSPVRAATPPAATGTDDPFLWLEDIDSPRALAWIKEHNAATEQRLAPHAENGALFRDALAALDSSSRIPEVTLRGGQLYNLWRDRAHPRGLWRRTTLAGFRQENPSWETVLDVDALAKTEGKPWAFAGALWLGPDHRRCLVRLALAGGDAAEFREFDPAQRAFVAGGFVLPVAKSRVAWRDADSLFVATDFGPGTLNESGYPRLLKLWRRGTPLASAEAVHETPTTSVWVAARRLHWAGGSLDLVTEQLTFWEGKFFQFLDGRLRPLALPATTDIEGAFRGRLVLRLKEDWTIHGATYRTGSVVLAEPAALRGEKGTVELALAPTASEVVEAVRVNQDSLYATILDHVRGRLARLTPAAGGGWTRQAIAFPDHGTVRVTDEDADSGDAFVEFESFTTPPALYHVAAGATTPQLLKAQAPTFDGARFEARQFFAASADGTKVPYFVVGPRALKLDGKNPTWMFSYGGFENALKPSYSGSYEHLHGAYGKLWLERGGVFVLANIRGGGEFGPAWHNAALKENHVRCFEDFEAVARDLAARKITSARHLGIEGRSNGGLLVGATMLRHPELYGAVVCGNPLLDMQRYHRLLAGASWVAEYGHPDVPAEWAYLSQYSPYQNVHAGQKLPPVLFYTTTRDDRVHPGHARKMAAKMEALGYVPEYFENTEGGHHGSVTNEQLATRLARTYAFLWSHLR